METFEIGNSPGHAIWLILLSTLFVIGGIFVLISRGPDAPMAWLTIGFFGLGVVIGLWRLFDTRPRLIIDDAGIVDRTLGAGRIEWVDVEAAYPQTIQGQSFVCLQLVDEQKYLSRMSPTKRALAKANRMIGFTPIVLNLSGIDQQADKVMDVVEFYCDSSSA